jgi:hypothetical protein
MGRRLISGQMHMQRHPLPTSSIIKPDHSVLAPLSQSYPQSRGRLPTRYSPVRHSTEGRSPVRVRLACVRHAASVHSEPESNSPVENSKATTLPKNLTLVLLAIYLSKTVALPGAGPAPLLKRPNPCQGVSSQDQPPPKGTLPLQRPSPHCQELFPAPNQKTPNFQKELPQTKMTHSREEDG